MCAACDAPADASEWFQASRLAVVENIPRERVRCRAKDRAGQVWDVARTAHLEELFSQLFYLHDLNNNGLLEEAELIALNEKIALLHCGSESDTGDVRDKYKALFRAKLDPRGRPVPYEKFREYTREVVEALDRDPECQEMILEQFIAEAESVRAVFGASLMAQQPKAPGGGLTTVLVPATSPRAAEKGPRRSTRKREPPAPGPPATSATVPPTMRPPCGAEEGGPVAGTRCSPGPSWRSIQRIPDGVACL